MGSSTGAVFLSYASEDSEAAARIAHALQAAGIEVWFDRNELRGGDAWNRRIREQIHNCRLFIAVISAHTEARDEGYFRREWNLAVDRTHDMAEKKAFLVPVVIDGTSEREASVPEKFRELQWTRLPGGEASPAFVERVRRLLSLDHAEASERPPAVPVRAYSYPSTSLGLARKVGLFGQRRRIFWGLAVIVVLAVGYLAVERFWLSKHVVARTQATPLDGPSATPAQDTIPEKSIAVLPFVDMSQGHDQEYFSDGLSEELIDHLARAAGLKVVARTSSFQFKGKSEDVRSIAGKLGVAHLLEGSVRAAGHEMRITVQLIRASDGTHLWSQSYDRQISDIFKVQDEIAGKVAQALSTALSSGPTHPDSNEKNPAAYDLLLKGNFFYARNHKNDWERAIDCYRQALALDPNYALAWAKLARVYIQQARSPAYPVTIMEPKARDALHRALAIDPNSAVAHRWLGRVYMNLHWDWAAAASELERAIALDSEGPEGKLAQGDLGVLTALTTGEFGDAIQRAITDQASNPLDPAALWFLGWFLELGGRHEQAAAYQLQLLDLDPDYLDGHGFAAATALAMGKSEYALAEAQKEPDEEVRLAMLARVYWKLGRSADANRALDQLESKFANDAAYDIAVVHASRGDTDATLSWLERAYRQHDGRMIFLKVDALLASVRSQPRYQSLMKKMQLKG